MAKAESIELFMTEGKHNKTYLVWLRERYANGLWTVDFAYGRIGSSLKYGTKTDTPVSYLSAKKLYDDLVQSKLDKGYITNKELYTAGKEAIKPKKIKAIKMPTAIEPEPIETPKSTVQMVETFTGRKFR